MGNIHYMISEAAKEVGVESHVLRYWEEEMNLVIDRTEMGHRYYTEEDLELFQCIRKLKDEGVLIKELKVLVPELQRAKKLKKQEDERIKIRKLDKKQDVVQEKIQEKKLEASLKKSKEKATLKTSDQKEINQKESYQKEINEKDIEYIIEKILKKNNIDLEQGICELVTESIKKEMTYLLDAKDQLEDDRYRRLDTLIRQQQVMRKEQSKKSIPIFKHVLGT